MRFLSEALMDLEKLRKYQSEFEHCLFPKFSHRNIDRSYVTRQEAIALIFVLVIEDLKVYHLECLKVFAL
jgi:hypothetical protein